MNNPSTFICFLLKEAHPGLSFFKNYSIRERFTIQYRAEMFNAFNTPQFQSPNNSITSSNFGVITGAGAARQIQMALKLLW